MRYEQLERRRGRRRERASERERTAGPRCLHRGDGCYTTPSRGGSREGEREKEPGGGTDGHTRRRREKETGKRRESEKTARKTRAVADRENAKEITLPGASETAREGRGSLSQPGRRDKDEADKRTDEGARGRGYSVSRPRATRAHAPSRPAVQPATTPSSSSSSPPYSSSTFPRSTRYHSRQFVCFFPDRDPSCDPRYTKELSKSRVQRRFERAIERSNARPVVLQFAPEGRSLHTANRKKRPGEHSSSVFRDRRPATTFFYCEFYPTDDYASLRYRRISSSSRCDASVHRSTEMDKIIIGLVR